MARRDVTTEANAIIAVTPNTARSTQSTRSMDAGLSALGSGLAAPGAGLSIAGGRLRAPACALRRRLVHQPRAATLPQVATSANTKPLDAGAIPSATNAADVRDEKPIPRQIASAMADTAWRATARRCRPRR